LNYLIVEQAVVRKWSTVAVMWSSSVSAERYFAGPEPLASPPASTVADFVDTKWASHSHPYKNSDLTVDWKGWVPRPVVDVAEHKQAPADKLVAAEHKQASADRLVAAASYWHSPRAHFPQP
jgi:hypothetical protein